MLDSVILLLFKVFQSWFLPDFFLEDGSVWSFGYNVHGELGIGHKNATLEPQKLNLEPIQSISVGYYPSIALSSNTD